MANLTNGLIPCGSAFPVMAFLKLSFRVQNRHVVRGWCRVVCWFQEGLAAVSGACWLTPPEQAALRPVRCELCSLHWCGRLRGRRACAWPFPRGCAGCTAGPCAPPPSLTRVGIAGHCRLPAVVTRAAVGHFLHWHVLVLLVCLWNRSTAVGLCQNTRLSNFGKYCQTCSLGVLVSAVVLFWSCPA